MLNDVPSAYYCHLDSTGQRTDRNQRPELCNGSVELVAPSEYMVRPPVSPVYFFVIDVSVNAVGSGMLQVQKIVGRALQWLHQNNPSFTPFFR
jgi:protein transport protein SEC24